MKKKLIYTTILTLCVTTAEAGLSIAQVKEPNVMERVAKAVFMTPEEAMLDNVARARVYITNGNNDAATKELDMAIAKLAEVKRDPNMQMQVISFDYGKDLMSKNIMIPITGSKATADTIRNSIQTTVTKDTMIDNAKVEYITFVTTKKDIEHDLVEAKAALAKNNMTGADFNLLQWRVRATDKDRKDIPYAEKVRANLALARVMTQDKNYSSAKSAVDEAREALRDYKGTVEYEAMKADYESMESELDTISQDIDKKDPSMMTKIDSTLEKWWNKLASQVKGVTKKNQ